MTTISFMVNGAIVDQTKPMAWVTIEEMDGGSLFFKVKQMGGIMSNLYGLYFEVLDKSILNTLRISAVSNDMRLGANSIRCLRNGINMLVSPVDDQDDEIGKEVVYSYSFILSSKVRELLLSDFPYIKLDYAESQPDSGVSSNDDDSHKWLYMSLLSRTEDVRYLNKTRNNIPAKAWSV